MSASFHFGNDARKIFDLLVYRCREKQYWEEQEKDSTKYVCYLGLDPFSKAQAVSNIEQHWFEKHGGPWSFNEAVGLISIFAAPYKISALFYFPTQRIMKHMKKRRVFVSKLFEFNVWPEEDAETIYKNLRQWLSNTILESHCLRGRVIDFEPLDTLGPHIDWIGITHKRSDQPAPYS